MLRTARPPARGSTITSSLRRFVPSLLRVGNFRHFWVGQTISVIGDQVTALAMPLVAVLVLDATPGEMGILAAVSLLPHLFFSLPAGVWLDRVRRRRRVMIAADLGRAALVASVPLAYVADALTLEQLLVVGFFVGALTVAFDLSWSIVFVAVTPREKYVEGSSLLNGSRSLSYILGPTLGGAMVQVLSAPITLAADALSFVASALFLGRVKAEEAPVEADPAGLRERFAAGLSFAAHDPIIRPTLAAAATINFFNFGFSALFVLYATRSLGVSPGTLGLALGVGAIGGLLGAVVAGPIGKAIGVGPAYAVGCILFPAPLILIPLASGTPEVVFLALLVSEFGAGLGVMILDVNAGSIIIARTPDRIRARATGAFRTLNYGIRPIGAFVGGVLGATIGVRETLFIVTVAPLLSVLWLLWSPVIRQRDLPEPAELGLVEEEPA
jgi:MFS family permease